MDLDIAMFNRPPVSEDIQDWLIGEFEWAIAFGLLRKDTKLVTPEKTFFPAPKGDPEQIVKGLIANILEILGHGGDQIEVLPLDRPSAEYRAAGAFQSLCETAGAWDGDIETSTIFYDPEMVARPGVLLATLTHEVMHHVLHKLPSAQSDPEEELRTDVQMVTSGFGLIAMIGAEESGWLGYLRQPTRAHGLAMFLSLLEMDHRSVQRWLTGRMLKAVRRSLVYIEKTEAVVTLKNNLATQVA